MRHGILIAAGLLVILAAGPLGAATVKKVIRAENAGPSLLKADAWHPFEKGFERSADTFVCDNGSDPEARRGVSQTVVLNQKTPQPIAVAAWSKAEGVGGTRDSDYAIYLDLVYDDGSPLWGQTAAFTAGTHDWERREVHVFPARPVKSVTVNLLLRGHAGKAAFRGAELREVAPPQGTALFDGLPLTQVGAPAERFLVRDVAAESDFVDITNGHALGLTLRDRSAKRVLAFAHDVTLTDVTGKDRAITLVYTMPLKGNGWQWLGDLRHDTPAEPPKEYSFTTGCGDVGMGRLSRYPFAAVQRRDLDDGQGIAADMGCPAFFRVGFSAATNELYIAYDIALTPEKPAAELRFCTFIFKQSSAGMRHVVAVLYEFIYPEYFRCRTPEQGLWMPFGAISKVEGWEDFGFKFKEGNDETAWDDAHHILTFRYTEPQTWWMTMPKTLPRTLEAAEAEARRLAEKGSAEAKALLASGYRDASGRLVARLRNEPWCNGAVWSMNSAPGIAGDATDFKNKWNPALREKLYGPQRKGDLDGEYIDSSEGYVTDELDFARDHFAAMQAPLVFASDSHRPAIFRGLVVYEYVRAIAEDMHKAGKLMMANGTPGNLPWLPPLLDVMGTETDWNSGGRWHPMADADLMYRRVLCGPKPYCFLMNTNFDKWPYELTEKYMKRCLAYGMFPGFFSADASTKTYFSQPALYNRDRPLFKKYVPLIKRVAEAGWQPITQARSSNPKVYVERWGEKLLTVFNDSAERQTAEITVEAAAPKPSRELVRSTDVPWKNGKATLTLEPEDVAVIELP
jgi:hypothetical protein